MSSKFQLICSCVHCHIETTVQSLKHHYDKCTRVPHKCCGHCGALTSNDRFCSRSCRTTHVNKERALKKTRVLKQSRREMLIEAFLRGEVSDRNSIRKCLTDVRGYACEICGLSNWLSKPITLIVDHIDGNAGNNQPDNVRLLCPNCNSQTPMFGGRNKGKGRRSRGLPLH